MSEARRTAVAEAIRAKRDGASFDVFVERCPMTPTTAEPAWLTEMLRLLALDTRERPGAAVNPENGTDRDREVHIDAARTVLATAKRAEDHTRPTGAPPREPQP